MKENQNDKIKSVWDEFNESPTMIEFPNTVPCSPVDSATFSSEKNHTSVSTLTSMDTSEFNTSAKEL